MLLRVRTHLGVWKVEVPDDATAADLKRVLVQKYNPEGGLPQPLTRDPRWQEALDDDAPLAAGGVAHGDMIYLRLEEGQVGSHEESKTARTITKDGQIVMQQFSSVSERNGFRPGMLPLSAMKKHWTLQEFVDLDNQFVFQMKRQEEATCKGASVDQASLNSFQTFMRRLDFRRLRVGMLYGTYTEDGKVQAECIYEPPQEADDKHFTFLDDPQQERVDALAAMLSLQKVGWIFAHPPREEGFFFSGNEVLTAAELQLEAAGGVEETPFVTVKVTLNAEGETQVEAYQVSQLAMRMVAEEALQLHAEKLDNLRVNSTFTVTQEGRETSEVESAFFLCNVPIIPFESTKFCAFFPKPNRDDEAQTLDAVRLQLEKAKEGRGWTLEALLTDFALLLFLTDFFPVHTDMPLLVQAAVDRTPLPEGFRLMLDHLTAAT